MNPADTVRPSSIAMFEPRDRSLTPSEIKLLYKYLDRTQCGPTMRLACKMLLLTMVRKSELTDATWSKIDFERALWTIPGVRMKRRNPHNVYLPRLASIILSEGLAFPFVRSDKNDSEIPAASASSLLVRPCSSRRRSTLVKKIWLYRADSTSWTYRLAAKKWPCGGMRHQILSTIPRMLGCWRCTAASCPCTCPRL